MDGVKNLIIDFGGVIINLARNRCIDAFEKLGVDVRDKLINNYQHKDLFMQLELGTITASQFREGIRHLTQQCLTDTEIDTAWIAMLDEVDTWKLDLLLEQQKQYNIMLLSNTNVIHWHWSEKNIFSYKGHTPADFFSKIYLSYELHKLKPNTDIFEYVLNDAAIEAGETLLIDDALVNCHAAASLGIRTYMPEPREDWSSLFKR
ncbi:HAD family phosphatase [Parabacteroides sp. 52]|uniref:HAD family hydrolase n=1 Tax=unclassified Parabacteroides TaxID=2649774 RepID=UPI0013D26580|nr:MULTISPECIES: HAD family phosphatase [unclassified Parabacteroides]MDH6534025.1 FMN phosphatase YigB (HAD superfamily) [Parabacteroides sp. PM5-20]NDV54767.1 HAD family phosphatase [Parabacteroides sp. 52]